eukprot:GEMP01050982.1.p1 GENE.GEMP01050982.1~~GEMP01050982.1.p1  ORF type:complete len:274 (+),score=45.62 GEMP01050982.1:22-843(+)
MLGGNRLSCDGNGNNNDDPNNDSVSIVRAMRTASSSYETISGEFDSSFTDARTWSGNSRLMEERLSGDRNDAVTWCYDDLENMNEDPLFNLDPYAYDGDKVTRGFVDSSAMTHDLFGFNIRDDADMWFAPKAPTFASYPMMDPAIVPVVPVTIEPQQIPMSLKPPRAPDMLLSTACTVSGHDPQYIAGTIVNFFADLELLCSEFTEDKFEVDCVLRICFANWRNIWKIPTKVPRCHRHLLTFGAWIIPNLTTAALMNGTGSMTALWRSTCWSV